MDSLYDLPVTMLDGRPTTLAEHRGKVLLVVNVASRCALTGQYAGLEALFRKYKDAGLVVLGFPCDQFGHQEPGTETEIQAFCSTKYDVTFPMFAKVEVNGPNAHPLFQRLKAARPGWFGSEKVKWNFTKFLVGRDGEILRRFGPGVSPGWIEKAIVDALK
ncbi:MAG TPA: glutathione peroxidase [Gemmataceae bacterium]|jgi:glutathione peroxidase|nr:glutathione peroxidase [Gemmataceae bacterium]